MNRHLTGHAAAGLLLACGWAVAVPSVAVAHPTSRPDNSTVLGSISLISAAPDGTPANGLNSNEAISADGRYVAFESTATNLVPNDTDSDIDIFVFDRVTGDLELVTSDSAGRDVGGYDPAISADGRFVAYSATDGTGNVVVHDRRTGVTTLASVGIDGSQDRDSSRNPAISADGRFVAFESWAENLVADDRNNVTDVFMRDMVAGVTTRVSVDSAGVEAPYDGSLTGIPSLDDYGVLSGNPSISADGRYVVFESLANLDHAPDTDEPRFTNVFTHDRLTGHTTRVSTAAAEAAHDEESRGHCVSPTISADGRYVAFTSDRQLSNSDTDYLDDVFVFDRETATTTLIGGDAAGPAVGRPALSADGRFVAFSSDGVVYRHDRQTSTMAMVDVAPDGTPNDRGSYGGAISADGRHVTFWSIGFPPLVTQSMFLRDFGPAAGARS